MSTIWDRAVRALQPLTHDIDADGHPLAYYCGGDGGGSFCAHPACRATAALANAGLLHYGQDELAASPWLATDGHPL